MIKILFICHGNICRSPMAEFVMKDLVHRRGMDDVVHIQSAATSSEEIGNPVYAPARRKLEENGLDCKGKHAVQMTKQDYDRYDYLICMEDYNIRNMLRITGGDPDHKIHKLMEYTSEPVDIADPWYSGDFDTTYQQIEQGCTAFLDKLCAVDMANRRKNM